MKVRELKWIHHKSEDDVYAFHICLWVRDIGIGVPSKIEMYEGEAHIRSILDPCARLEALNLNFCTIFSFATTPLVD